MSHARKKILVAGDLHLGREPSRLPASLDAEGVSVVAVWERMVDLAIREGAGLVLLSGDVVDEANHRFEARGMIERGLRQLAEHGVMVVAVAGNHDYEALPAIAELLDSPWFYLLGQKGWERWSWEVEGEVRLHVDGWSFPSRHVSGSPLLKYDLPASQGSVPIIGMVHGDLGVADSPYAPLMANDLSATGIRHWILGHIHRPGLTELANGGYALYPGSLQPLDPGETGRHGAWWVDISDESRPVQVGLATLRYESIPVDLQEVVNQSAAERRIDQSLQRLVKQGEMEHDLLAGMIVRLSLTGRTEAHDTIGRISEAMVDRAVMPIGETGSIYIERIRNETTLPVDLEEIAAGGDAASLVARMILDLNDPESLAPETQRLIRETSEAISERRAGNVYRALNEPPDEPVAQVIARTRRAAWALLDSLLAQRKGAA